MKKWIAILFTGLLLAVGCANDDTQTTATTDTAAEEQPKKDFATRVGDTVGTATANADELRKEENERVDEVNEAMEE